MPANDPRDLLEAIEEVLVCPLCHGVLLLEDGAKELRCSGCQDVYPVCGGIPIFLRGSVAQEAERKFRDELAAKYLGSDRRTLLGVVAQHHCIPLMRKRAERFRKQFKPGEWILDVGIGYGWHWVGQGPHVKILGVDISFSNLMLAQHLLSGCDGRVLLVCADVAALPIREHAISGVWSVQVFQHFPEIILKRAQAEFDHVVKDEFLMEIYNLNPAWVHRVLYRVMGKRLHCRGRIGEMELNRLSAQEWANVWRNFRGGRPNISVGYSELFFHPNFHLRPQPYPLRLERFIAACIPWLAALIARQVHIRIETRGVE